MQKKRKGKKRNVYKKSSELYKKLLEIYFKECMVFPISKALSLDPK